jgi:hypothetical protein
VTEITMCQAANRTQFAEGAANRTVCGKLDPSNVTQIIESKKSASLPNHSRQTGKLRQFSQSAMPPFSRTAGGKLKPVT